MAGFVDWGRGLLESVRNDPNLKRALFQTGASFMRTPQMGQSGWDIAADALSGGANTLYVLREQERRQREAEEQKQYTRGMEGRQERREETKVGYEGRRLGAYEGELASQQAAREATAGREAEALPSEIEARKAQAAQARAGAAENYAQAALAQRTDPNLRGGAGGAGAGGFDVQSLEALTAEYVAAGMEPVAAKAKAAREIRAAKTPSKRDAYVKSVQDEIKILMEAEPFKFERTPQEMSALTQLAEQNVRGRMQFAQASADKGDKEKWIGKAVSFASKAGGPPIQGVISDVVEGKAKITFKDGTTKIVDVAKLEQ